MASASRAAHEVPVFAGKLAIPDFGEVNVDYGMGANLQSLGLVALIGRDLLQSAALGLQRDGRFVSLSI